MVIFRLKECTNIFHSQLNIVWDQHETFRFIWQFLSGRHRNRYLLTLKEFNCISQSYHSSLSFIIRRSDFQANSLQRVGLLKTVLQYSTLMLSSRRKNIKLLRLESFQVFSPFFKIYFYTHGISFPGNTPRPNILAHLKGLWKM